MKLITLVLVVIMTMGLFTGCGKKEKVEDESLGSIVIDSQESEDVAVGGNTIPDKTLEDETNASQEETTQTSENVINNGNIFESEDAVEVIVDEKPIKLKMTREELDKMVEDYGYTIKDPKYVKSIYTSAGEISEVSASDNGLMKIAFTPNRIDFSKVFINGTPLNKIETLKNDSNLIEENDDFFKISIADYTTLTVRYNNDGEVYIIFLIRQQYSLR